MKEGQRREPPASKLLQQRDKREVRPGGMPQAAASSPRRAGPGCQACKCRTERKRNKQTQEKSKKRTQKNPKQKEENHNRNKPTPRGMQCDNPKLEGPSRVEELGLQRGHNSFRVIPPSTLPCNSDPSVEVLARTFHSPPGHHPGSPGLAISF